MTLTEQVTGLAIQGLYPWRARVLYAPFAMTGSGITESPNPVHGPWRRVQAQAGEADIAIGAFEVDSAGDGAYDAIESGGLNGGDGNGDRTGDVLQNAVATVPDAEGVGYVTVEELSGNSGGIQGVRAASEMHKSVVDPLYDYPFGLVAFRVPCAAAQVRVLFHGAKRNLPAYRKFGPTTPGDATTTAASTARSSTPVGWRSTPRRR